MLQPANPSTTRVEAGRHLIRRARTGFARPASEKPSSALAHSAFSVNPTLAQSPAAGLLPLAAQHGAVSFGPCWGAFGFFLLSSSHCFLTSPSTRSLFLLQNHRQVRHRSAIAPIFIPSCLDLVVRSSLSYRHRQPRHSIRETQKQSPPTYSLFCYQNAPNISTQPFLETWTTSTSIPIHFQTNRRDEGTVNHSAATLTQHCTFRSCTHQH